MLFLLNTSIIEIDAPELHLAKHWKRIGCGDPSAMRASDAVDFAIRVVNNHVSEAMELDDTTSIDLAALIISKTGANAALFAGSGIARLNVLAEPVLRGLQSELGKGRIERLDELWTDAA
ncbi:MAG: hypothetical protein AAF683_01260 [Pseudomonadota bacterium]